ncbi:uncharacterized protein BP01DRAFT_105713 [Aspergillus saccharolyticus JOP 1030-1]|uniref:Uncharacterized protein n=1 Tax=Aspergillus saccharolyticus JOP 1030-1 TaxID=1450539 RepID=A0A318Z7X9_9EURO|nr:hypothetical protein BP01DRAFT_105713 [Aspergillus saccharolyticus JOP 1030-1]PYH43229.1 hypothetical protein BP01DRAFT_105713 [Aspergillus saccharolyticus JOP 1030-1]
MQPTSALVSEPVICESVLPIQTDRQLSMLMVFCCPLEFSDDDVTAAPAETSPHNRGLARRSTRPSPTPKGGRATTALLFFLSHRQLYSPLSSCSSHLGIQCMHYALLFFFYHRESQSTNLPQWSVPCLLSLSCQCCSDLFGRWMINVMGFLAASAS